MINSTGPDGSVQYSVDPSAPGGYSQATTLSPQEQAIFGGQTSAETGALGLANTQLGRVGSALGTSIDPSSFGALQTSAAGGPIQTSVGGAGSQQAINDAENAAYKSQTQYLDPQFQQAQASNTANLEAQGLNANDAAYQNQSTLLNNQQNQAYQGAANAAVTAGQQEQNTLYGQGLASGEFANQAQGQQYDQNYQNATLGNTAQQQGFQQGTYAQELPINEFSALLGSGQVTAPTGVSYTPSTAASTNVLQAYQNSFNDQAQNDAVTNKATNSALGGLFNLGTSFF